MALWERKPLLWQIQHSFHETFVIDEALPSLPHHLLPKRRKLGVLQLLPPELPVRIQALMEYLPHKATRSHSQATRDHSKDGTGHLLLSLSLFCAPAWQEVPARLGSRGWAWLVCGQLQAGQAGSSLLLLPGRGTCLTLGCAGKMPRFEKQMPFCHGFEISYGCWGL